MQHLYSPLIALLLWAATLHVAYAAPPAQLMPDFFLSLQPPERLPPGFCTTPAGQMNHSQVPNAQ